MSSFTFFCRHTLGRVGPGESATLHVGQVVLQLGRGRGHGRGHWGGHWRGRGRGRGRGQHARNLGALRHAHRRRWSGYKQAMG